jgi:hypothetical protein
MRVIDECGMDSIAWRLGISDEHLGLAQARIVLRAAPCAPLPHKTQLWPCTGRISSILVHFTSTLAPFV